ncbi:MAG: hypothetical protein KDE24_38020 [Caldilinea sp.]|nr:hypothetical protein [Caldilinea sp.]
MLLLIICAALIVNAIIGAAVLAAIDSDNEIARWADSSPVPGITTPFILELWPIIAWVYLKG